MATLAIAMSFIAFLISAFLSVSYTPPLIHTVILRGVSWQALSSEPADYGLLGSEGPHELKSRPQA